MYDLTEEEYSILIGVLAKEIAQLKYEINQEKDIFNSFINVEKLNYDRYKERLDELIKQQNVVEKVLSMLLHRSTNV